MTTQALDPFDHEQAIKQCIRKTKIHAVRGAGVKGKSYGVLHMQHMMLGFLIKPRPCVISITATEIADKDTIRPLQGYLVEPCNVWLVHFKVDNSTSGYNSLKVIFACLGRCVVVK
jgi:hypothetical protein